MVDAYPLPVGVRTVEVRGTQFLINGEPFYFTGFGKHEDPPVRGKGHDDAFIVHDFALMEWIGANSFRTSHYPYAEEVLDYADRHGIVVIDETAAVGLNTGLAGGIFGGEGYPTFSEETINAATSEVHAQAIRELVARDKNHPCVVLWSIANEPESHTDAARDYFEPLVRADPRARPHPTGRLRQRHARAARRVPSSAELFDVVMLNRYYGWYVAHRRPRRAPSARCRPSSRRGPANGKPIIITEYGADTVRRPARRPPAAVDRGVPGRVPRP